MTEGLVLLVLVWAVLLVPSAIRARRASPHATVGGFERTMDVLRSDQRSRDGRQVLVPEDAGRIVDGDVRPVYAFDTEGGAMPASEDQVAGYREVPEMAGQPGPGGARPEDPIMVRRRSRFVRLLVATAATFLLGLLAGGWLWLVFVATVTATAGYTALLRRLKVQRDEARRVVADLYLHDESAPAEPVPAVVGGEDLPGASVRLRRWDD